MVQELFPHVFHNEFVLRSTRPEDVLFVFRDDRVLLKVQDGKMTLPTVSQLQVRAEDCRSLFRLDDVWYSMLREEGMEAPEGFGYYLPREYREFRPMEALFPCAAAGSLNRWYRDNQFCGRCGRKLEDSRQERALVCPGCGCTRYPKICPAVIVGVCNGEKLLLTKYAGRAIKTYALVAGYNEIGESMEDTVRREVLEEVGLRVRNIRFYRSQPWVFTDTVLMGFFCDLDGDDRITLQESELSLGTWVSREDLPEDKAHLSLTAEMIDQFRLGRV